MPIFLYNFFHNETNDRTEKGSIKIPKNSNDWPESWKKIEYKNYSLFKSIKLIKEKTCFFELLSKRRSSEGYILDNKVTIDKLAYILQCGYGLQGGSKEEGREENRTVPSGGKRYSLEIYIFLFKEVDNCKPGVYHYGIQEHVLEPVSLQNFSREDILSFTPQEWLKETTGMICITSIFDRTVRKYGSMGYRLILLEAGHVGQNILLAGTEKNININPVAGIYPEKIEQCIGLGRGERIVYTLFF
jgi:SagB-type dehydrogenase family enzyme